MSMAVLQVSFVSVDHLIVSRTCCRYFEATRRQLADLLRIRHPKAGAVAAKSEPALASARGKLQL